MNRLPKIGDWVSGTSVNDERILGYIDNIHHQTGSIVVRVVQSDRKKAVGDLIRSDISRLKQLPMAPFQAPGHLLNLIDIALTNHDQEWFMELTTKLKETQQKTQMHKQLPSLLPKNRWKKYGIQ